jgi:quinol-cytochrome oxidoreductase complex cytochrome b subunit
MDSLPFTPFYLMKDVFSLGFLFILFLFFIYSAPDLLGHPDNMF